MKNETASMRILKWLRGNGIPLGALTSHDTACLWASVEIANVWLRGDRNNRLDSAQAYGLIVGQMQSTTQFMAYHGIAMVGEWSDRVTLWDEAHLSFDVLDKAPNCKFGPNSGKVDQGEKS